MSSTITCGKRATAFKTPDGRTVYVLFESTYESNVFPQHPSCSAIYFGYLPGALRRIFGLGSACEGGGLRNRGGGVKPENYIGAWLRELASPEKMPNASVALVCTESWRSPLSTDHVEPACAILETHNYQEQAEALRNKREAKFQIHDDGVVLSELCDELQLSSWRFINAPGQNLEKDPSLGYRPTPGVSVPMPKLTVYKADDENRIMKDGTGVFRCAGWQYSAIANFVQDLWIQEKTDPGSYKKLIPAFRAAMENADPIPEGTRVVIDLSEIKTDWGISRVKEIEEKSTNTLNGKILEVTPNAEVIYNLCAIGSIGASWVIPAVVV